MFHTSSQPQRAAHRRPKSQGFTLIELLVVIAIIATRQSLIRRREMVFFNGLTLRQVFTPAELSDAAGDATFYIGGSGEGNFSATGTRNTLYINPPGDVTLSQLNAATLEFAVRGFALKVVNRKNVVLRGLVCQHATHYQSAAAR